MRSFCYNCGTHLTFEDEDFPDVIDITTCSLDDPEAIQPKDHTWMSSKLNWIRLGDTLPEYRESRHTEDKA
jgi:hypothetical protein